MSALNYIIGGWLILNAAVVVALSLKRSRPKLRERLFHWVIDDGSGVDRRSSATWNRGRSS